MAEIPSQADTYFFDDEEGERKKMSHKPHFKLSIKHGLKTEKGDTDWETVFKMVFFAQSTDTILLVDIVHAIERLIDRTKETKNDA